MTDRWLLERAMSMLAALLAERDRVSHRLVTLPPEEPRSMRSNGALVAALDRTGWVQAHAAKMLG